MQRHGKRRWAAIIAPPLVAVGMGTLVACRDTTDPKPRGNDEWAASAAVGMQVRSELTLFENVRPIGSRVASHRVTQPVLTGFDTRFSALREKAGRHDNNRTVVRHFKARSGATLSIGLHFEREGIPPKFIYLFENGQIQAIVSPKYERHGRGYLRTNARITFFSKSGVPISQVDQALERSASTSESPRAGWLRAVTARAVKDVAQVLLPKPLHAEEADACITEWVSYFAASTALAAANATLIAAAAVCPLSGGTACPVTLAAFVAWTAALASWTDKLDRLTTCIAKSRADDDGVTSGGEGGGGGDSYPEDIPEAEDLKTVSEFIEDSIAAGNFYCTDGGDRCVYYAA